MAAQRARAASSELRTGRHQKCSERSTGVNVRSTSIIYISFMRLLEKRTEVENEIMKIYNTEKGGIKWRKLNYVYMKIIHLFWAGARELGSSWLLATGGSLFSSWFTLMRDLHTFAPLNPIWKHLKPWKALLASVIWLKNEAPAKKQVERNTAPNSKIQPNVV